MKLPKEQFNNHPQTATWTNPYCSLELKNACPKTGLCSLDIGSDIQRLRERNNLYLHTTQQKKQ